MWAPMERPTGVSINAAGTNCITMVVAILFRSAQPLLGIKVTARPAKSRIAVTKAEPTGLF